MTAKLVMLIDYSSPILFYLNLFSIYYQMKKKKIKATSLYISSYERNNTLISSTTFLVPARPTFNNCEICPCEGWILTIKNWSNWTLYYISDQTDSHVFPNSRIGTANHFEATEFTPVLGKIHMVKTFSYLYYPRSDRGFNFKCLHLNSSFDPLPYLPLFRNWVHYVHYIVLHLYLH